MSLKSVNQITQNVKFDEGFSVVDTAASLAGNRDFLEGYVDYVNGDETPKSHIWNVIGAVGNDIGNTIYTNIQNYIDLASNIDTCKIVALRSMLNIEGCDYSIFNDIDLLPPEILDILDVMSIDRKILISHPRLNKTFQSDLSDSIQSDMGNDSIDDELTAVGLSVNTYQIDDDKYFGYIRDLYANVISGFLALEYNLTKANANDHYYIYPTLISSDSFDTYIIDDSRAFKLKNNIPVSFDESKIVDDIEQGRDSILNYSGAKYDLLITEMTARAKKLISLDLYDSSAAGFDASDTAIENKTRYSYYRRRKVKQYVDFVNSKYYFDVDLQLNGITYSYDPHYIEVCLQQNKYNVICKSGTVVGSPASDFDTTMIDEVATSLTKMTLYVASIREKLKKQVRKNYMKGTNNLLLYIINQYLLEYGMNSPNDEFIDNHLSAVYSNLANNDVKKINTIEYYDRTEYYDLSSATTGRVLQNTTNPRFWKSSDVYNGLKRDGLAFKCAEIEKFYLSTLTLKNSLSSSDELADFLDVVFDTGADESYVDSATGLFTAKLESGKYSLDNYSELASLSAASIVCRNELTFNSDISPLSAQIDDALASKYESLSAECLSGYSTSYDKHITTYSSLKSEVESLVASYSNMLTASEYRQYSLTDDTTLTAIYQKLLKFRNTQATSTKMTNTTALNAVDAMLALFGTASTSLSSQTKSIVTAISEDGFVDPCHPALEDEIAAATQFVQDYLNSHTSSDEKYSDYTQHLADLYALTNSYNASVANFTAIATSSSQTAGLGSLSYSGPYTESGLGQLKTSVSNQDATNLLTVQSSVAVMIDEYLTLESSFIDFAATLREDIGYSYGETYLEDQLESARLALERNRGRRYAEGMSRLEQTYQMIKNSVAVVKTSIRPVLSDPVSFEDAVSVKLDALNFLDDDYYQFKNDLYLTYGGESFCYYPYYNYKNMTHPSYQTHPFLWKFVEKSSYTTAIISKLFSSASVNDLELETIHDNADKYFGEFGQSIGIWKHFGSLDYSGYITDYEYSKHASTRSTLTSEVVDYDGSFYPPAVDMLLSSYSDCMTSLTSRTGEFYDRFYKHLALTDSEISYISAQIDEYWTSDSVVDSTSITDIVQPRPLSSVYDIYRYGKDKYGNCYTLYKQYFNDRPSYKEKRDTLGELWIRYKDQPLAFPAFSGKHPNFDMSQVNSVTDGIQKVSTAKYQADKPYQISSRMRMFFDFEISQSKTLLGLVSLNRDAVPYIIEQKTTYDDSYLSCYKMPELFGYQNPWIMSAPLIKQNIDQRQAMTYAVSGNLTKNSSSYAAFVRSGEVTSKSKLLSDRLPGDLEPPIENYALIGIYQGAQTGFNLLFVKKTYSSSRIGFSQSDNNVRILSLTTNGLGDSYTEGTFIYPGDVVDDEMCFTYDSESNTLVFAILTKIVDPESYYSPTSSYVDIRQNSSGPVFDDPRYDLEMTSHDIFDTNVTIVKATADGNKFTVSQLDYDTYNLNADMAFRPAYPGLSGEFHMREPLSSMASTTIQLLGKSKNLDKQIELMNTDADPYFDVDKIYDEYRFGRVYEDYVDEDNSLKVVSSPLINNIVREDTLSRGFEYYTLNVSTKSFNFTDHNFETTKMLFFNRDTAGKNPYFIGDLTSIYVPTTASEKWYSTSYNGTLSGDTISETELSGTSYQVTLAGTYVGTKRNAYDSNYIFNIDNIEMRFVEDTKTLQIRFKIADRSMLDYTHIAKGLLKMVFFNTCDLRIFKYYHFLDAYGAANARSAKFGINMTKQIAVDPWRVVYNYDAVGGRDLTTVIGDISSYYTYKNTPTYLQDLDLSQYDYLSDVYILQGNQRLSFKIDEDEYWPLSSKLYYYPVLNINYPKILADYVNELNPYKDAIGRTTDYMRVLGDRNTYILDLIDPDECYSKLSSLDIPLLRTPEESYLVYEDFNEKDDSGFANYKKYDANDVRNLPFLQCTEINDDALVERLATGDLKDLTAQYTTVDSFFTKLGEYSTNGELAVLKTQEDVEYAETTHVEITSDLSSINIDEFVKLYANYKRSDDGITLYFNYYNYIDTPYVKIKDNKIYQDIIEGTYLSVESGQNGYIDIVVQARYYAADELYGYSNIKLATYQIFNVSDDKPKFVIRRATSVDSWTYDDVSKAHVNVIVNNCIVDASRHDETTLTDDGRCKGRFVVDVHPTTELSAPFSFEFIYPNDVVKLTPNLPTTTGSLDAKDYDVTDVPNEGYAKIKGRSSLLRKITLNFETFDTAEAIAQKYADQKFIIYADEPAFTSSRGNALSSATTDGYLTFESKHDFYLQLDSTTDSLSVLGQQNGIPVSISQ